MRFKDLTGKTFGRLKVLAYVGLSKNKKSLWECSCECGSTTTVLGASLLIGRTTSCGCFRAELVTESNITHGMRFTAENRAWRNMINRCYFQAGKHFRYYGGRGISVCQKWRDSFEKFFSDMGLKPSPKHSLDRIDVNGNYEPGNCRWATIEVQANNKRNSKRGIIQGRFT